MMDRAIINEMEQHIIELERQWDEAQLHHDIAAIDRILADDFIAIAWGGISSKADALEAYKSTDIELDFRKSVPQQVKVYIDSAMVVGQAAMRGRDKGVEMRAEAIYSRVYARQGSQWRMVLAHATIK
jgi:ketosteroid isomerase-like protein